ALERGVVMQARDLGELKTWSQATAAAVGGVAAAGAWDDQVAWWALLVALALTWLSGLDYARVAPGLLRGRALSSLSSTSPTFSSTPRSRHALRYAGGSESRASRASTAASTGSRSSGSGVIRTSTPPP